MIHFKTAMLFYFLFLCFSVISDLTFGSDLGDVCTSSSRCTQSDPNKECLSGKCVCQQGWLLEMKTQMCRKSRGESCSGNANECMETLSCLNSQCDCRLDQYYDTDQATCKTQKKLHAVCDGYTNECRTGTMCLPVWRPIKMCLCQPGHYTRNAFKRCTSTHDLNARHISVEEISTDSVTLNWSPPSNPGTSIQCYVIYNGRVPNPLCDLKTRRCQVRGLLPDTRYDIRISCSVKEGFYKGRASSFQPRVQLTTKQVYGGNCSIPNDLCVSPFVCQSSLRCGCPSGFCYNYIKGTCVPRPQLNNQDDLLCLSNDLENLVNHKKPYNGLCYGTGKNECWDENAECREIWNRYNAYPQKRCLCKSYYYFYNNVTSACQHGSSLQVTDIWVTRRETNRIYVSWNRPVTAGADISYTLRVSSIGIAHTFEPGTRYRFTVLTLVKEDYTTGVSQVSSKGITSWTMPDRPSGYNRNESMFTDQGFMFVFGKSKGQVHRYQVKVKTAPVFIGSTPTNSIILPNVTPGETIEYRIRAFNGNGDSSIIDVYGSFKANDQVSSQVVNLQKEAASTNTIIMTWSVPSKPNGVILAFGVKIMTGMNCSKSFVLKCNDCQTDGTFSLLDIRGCPAWTPGTHFNKTDVSQGSKNKFSQIVTSLEPFTNFTIIVFAINLAGEGNYTSLEVKTGESYPNNLSAVTVVGERDNITRQVGLKVTVLPGPQTGFTNFTITVSSLNILVSKTLIGYWEREATFMGLLPYQTYLVSAFARTKFGKSETVTQSSMTPTTNPDPPQNVRVVPDAKYSSEMTLTFDCPDMTNGIIQSYSLRKTSADSSFQSPDLPMTCGKTMTIRPHILGSFKVYSNYSLQVRVRNKKYHSDFSRPAAFYAAPKAPVLPSNVLLPDPRIPPTENTVRLSLTSTDIMNEDQGTIEFAALIVCVKNGSDTCAAARKRRAILTASDYMAYLTWAEAKAGGFKSSYRATTDTWHQTLDFDKPSFFVLGGADCSTDASKKTYCNGALPTGKTVYVFVVACTSAGCDASSPVVSKTTWTGEHKEHETESSSNNLVIIGVVIGINLLVCFGVCVSAFLFVRCRRQEPRSLQHTEDAESESRKNRTSVAIHDFRGKVAQMHSNSGIGFDEEFTRLQTICSRLQYTTHEAEKVENHAKIRDMNYLPYDHTRVRLEVAQNETSTDFINASHISNLQCQCEYIEAQDPLQATIPDFWRMVWEQKVKVIVMLSDITEIITEDLYWPENLKEPIRYGDLVVEMTKLSQRNKHTVRRFTITKGYLSREVTHFWFLGLWESGPNCKVDDILDFADLVCRETGFWGSCSPVVHCRNGTDRTGIFIAVDYFVRYIESHRLEDLIDVFNFVLEMCRSRPHMVQTVAQYTFLFDILAEVVHRRIQGMEDHVYDSMLGSVRQPTTPHYLNQLYSDRSLSSQPASAE